MLKNQEEKRGINRFFSDIKNAKRNYNIVRSSPYASMKLRYMIQRLLVILLILFLIYSFYNIIMMYNGGSSIMTLIGRALVLLILVIIITKAWGTLKPLKKAMEHYEHNPQHINYKDLNVKEEIDDILKDFENKSQGGIS